MNQALDSKQVKDIAANQWHETLCRLGIEAILLDGKHRPCPACGGKDRFRFDDKGKGSHICNQCGAGDGLSLVMKALSLSFPEALQAVAEILGLSGASSDMPSYKSPPKPAPVQVVSKDYTPILSKFWKQSQPLGGVALRYLQNRGFKLSNSHVLRFNSSLGYYGENGSYQGSYKALIALIQDVKGEVVGLHKTYLTDGGYKAPVPCAKKIAVTFRGVRITTGAAIRLCEAGEHLLLAEGIETALAVHEASGLPAWACISANGLKSVQLPSLVKKVTICADKDLNKAGEQAAKSLADRLVLSGVKVSVIYPQGDIEKGKKSLDFADLTAAQILNIKKAPAETGATKGRSK